MLNRIQDQKSIESVSLKRVSVSDIISELLAACRTELEQRNIRTELDVQPIDARADSQGVRAALQGLIRNAINSTPSGGEITITTIDSKHQWEIEVADSSGESFNEQPEVPVDCAGEDDEDLPVVFSFPSTEELRGAYRAAFEMGGEIQSWTCPQGGLAYLLVVPRRKSVKVAQ